MQLACPLDHQLLSSNRDNALSCPDGHSYPVIDGIPILLVPNIGQTIATANASLQQSQLKSQDAWYLETLGIDEITKTKIQQQIENPKGQVDPVISYLVAATNGYMYKHLIGNLTDYPIPELRLPEGKGKTFLDIGCNWGRWSISAARKGYQVVGLDPCLGAVAAARRLAQKMGVTAQFVVGDARHLPFADKSFDVVFSYSVIQHLSREDTQKVVEGVARVLASAGTSFIQMPNVYGVRCLYHQARRRFRAARGFEVRYWTIPALLQLFNAVGPSHITVDCFGGIGLQENDAKFMPPHLRLALTISAKLRKASRYLSFLKYCADSVYVESVKSK